MFKPHKYVHVFYSLELKFSEDLQAKRFDSENFNGSST